MNNLTDVVKNLIIINVIIFIGTIAMPQVYKDMGHLYFFLSDKFQPFQLITSMFMHANFSHLLFNMLGLFFLGPTVERTLGGKKFFILYMLAGLGGSLGWLGFNYYQYQQLLATISPEELKLIANEGMDAIMRGKNYVDPVLASKNSAYYSLMNIGALGASGAVYGVVIAFTTMFPNMKLLVFPLPFPIKALYVGLFMVASGLISGIGSLQPGIAHFAHVGGAITGFLLVHYWKQANLK